MTLFYSSSKNDRLSAKTKSASVKTEFIFKINSLCRIPLVGLNTHADPLVYLGTVANTAEFSKIRDQRLCTLFTMFEINSEVLFRALRNLTILPTVLSAYKLNGSTTRLGGVF
ncbi:hypothetical protein SAMN05216404_106229 [Nitrosospira multiformis]|uniref:Uncharacterized protein n=1 Tax=Nitrosospira multiformis TaxID=1231 RepID=A0A1H8IY35_9PROT|nr:hypothetical protein SAMN05216404_106229 [Nitrosospira multiformis]